MPDFTLKKELLITGKFEGWNPRTTYKLGDGSKWRLCKATIRNVKRNSVRVKLWHDSDDRYYFEVNCIPGKVEVAQVM